MPKKLNGNWKTILTLVGAIFAAGVWYSTINGVAETSTKHEMRLECLEEEYYEIQRQATEDFGEIKTDMAGQKTEMAKEFGKIDSRLTGIEHDMEFVKEYLLNGGSP